MKPIKKKPRHYVYIARCKYGTYYTGYTNDLKERIKKHNDGRGAKYLRGRSPVKMVWSREYKSHKNALSDEKRIKQLTRREKQLLIRGKDIALVLKAGGLSA